MIARFVSAVLLVLTMSSCLQTFTSVRVHRDGSAIVRDSVHLSRELRESGPPSADTVARFKSKLDSMARAHATDLCSTATVRSVKIVNEADPTGWVVEYAIPSINDLHIGRNRQMKMIASEAMAGLSESEEKKDDDPLLFSIANGTLIITNPPAATSATTDAPPKAQSKEEAKMALDMMQTFMSGLRISFTVSVEGPISYTDAQFVKGSTITIMDVDFDKLLAVWKKKPKLYMAMQGKHPSDPAGMQQAMKSLPKGTIVYETREKITVKF